MESGKNIMRFLEFYMISFLYGLPDCIKGADLTYPSFYTLKFERKCEIYLKHLLKVSKLVLVLYKMYVSRTLKKNCEYFTILQAWKMLLCRGFERNEKLQT